MSRESELIRYLMRRPDKAVLAANGIRPSMERIDAPLIRLLESITPNDRVQRWRQISLNPTLGYIGGATFANAEQLLRWLKPKDFLVGNESTPAESRRIKAFNKALTLADLAAHARIHPELS